jgi:hypothetical protein
MMLNNGLLPLMLIDKFKDELETTLGESLKRVGVLYAHIKENPNDLELPWIVLYLQSYDNLLQSIDEQINYYASLSLNEEQEKTLDACQRATHHLHDIKIKFEAEFHRNKTIH